jgi:hypothetical protein
MLPGTPDQATAWGHPRVGQEVLGLSP